MEFEVIEEYLLEGEHRFRIRVRGTKLVFNLHANTREEALNKAKILYDKLKEKLEVKA